MYFNFPEEYVVTVAFEEFADEEDRLISCEGYRTARNEVSGNIFEEADEEFVRSFIYPSD